MGSDPGADLPQGQRTRPKLAHALANCAELTVYPPQQLVEARRAFKGDSPTHTYHSFSTEQIHQTFYRTFTHSQATGDEKKAHGRAEFSLTAQNRPEIAQNFLQKAT